MKNTIDMSVIENAHRFSPAKQQGWTMWSLLFGIGITIFFAFIIMKLVPVYNQNNNVKNALVIAFDNADNVRSLKKNQYLALLQRQLFINEAHRDINFKELVQFTRSKTEVRADLKYSKVVPLFLNISLKVDFDESAARSFR